MAVKKLIVLFDSEEERDRVFERKLEKDFEIRAGHRVIRKITRLKRNKTRYGYEEKRV